MNKQFGFYLEPERCLKCWACEIACEQWHGIKAGTVKLRRVVEVSTGTYPDVSRTFLSVTCSQCAKAPCASVCPTGAITKRTDDGIVIVDKERCIGCHHCAEACPFGIPQFGEDGTMQKCDLCLERLKNGQLPICVATCPTQALHFGTLGAMAGLVTAKHAKKTALNARRHKLIS